MGWEGIKEPVHRHGHQPSDLSIPSSSIPDSQVFVYDIRLLIPGFSIHEINGETS